MSNDPIKLLQDAHRHFKDSRKLNVDGHTTAAITSLADGLAKMTESFLTIHVDAKMHREEQERLATEQAARGDY